MAPKHFPSLAAAAFAAMLFHFFLKRRSREIRRGEANNDAAATDGTAGGASGAHTSTESHGMTNSSGYDFEVFLSFRGPDTRATFTDHLYTSLKDAGICTFKDDEDLRKGEEFSPELLQAIKQSKVLVPIFSKDYATSVWCLKEVVQIVECMKIGGQKIIPIFYDVAPLEVRHQTGGYGEAFRSHENKKRHDKKTMKEWKAALSAVAAINGWDLQSMSNRREGEFVKTFTRKVFNELKKASLAVSDYLVGVDNHVDAIMQKIGVGTSETRIIGIHGMGGIGKTTIAKIVFNKFSTDFENCCFLRDIRETSKNNGVQWLQKQLISSILKTECTDMKDNDEGAQTIKNRLSNKRVLLLLDDVEKENHIDALICKRDWLGEGSKIIITTRRKDVLCVPEVDWRYELTGMDQDRSLQLFSKHAFRRDFPLDEYINQSNRAIDIAGGLPLALEVIGSLLCRTKKERWDVTLKMLESVPHNKIQSKLKISYDALNFRQKRIFLDIACLFIGYDKDILLLFWDESNCFPEDAMEVLQNTSLIKIIEDNKVWMHDQLRDLGREMIREESNTKIKKQSRVWDHKEGLDLLRRQKGKTEVEALRLNFEHEGQHYFTYEGFESLSNLKFLEVGSLKKNFRAAENLLWHESPSNVPPTNENSNLLPQLRWLSWCDFPLSLDIAKFFMEDVVILNLSESAITHDWKGWIHMKVMKNLKVLNLSNCRNLESLPEELGRDLARLEYLYLNNCELLKSLPKSIENLESMIELDISWTGIEGLPDSIGKLENLKKLKMEGSHISKIPDALWTIEKLEEIEASTLLGKGNFHVNIGDCICKNQSLRILRLQDANIHAVPSLPESLVTLRLSWLSMDTFPDLSNLANLKEVDLYFGLCDSDGPQEEYPIPQWIGNLSKLESLELISPYVTNSPTDLTLPPHLKELRLEDCPKLRRIPRLPSSLSSLLLERCYSLCSMGDLSNLKNLSYLKIWCVAIEEIQGLGCLENLQDLWLAFLEQVEMLPDLSNLNKLRHLPVESCDNLVEIQGELPQSLEELDISSCESLQKLPDLSSLKELQDVFIYGCTKLKGEAILGSTRRSQANLWKNLRHLKICRLEQLEILPDLRNLNKLRSLKVRSCANLVEIQGELPECLEELEISSCINIQKLPDLSILNGLREVKIYGCFGLDVEAITLLCSEKPVIFAGEDIPNACTIF